MQCVSREQEQVEKDEGDEMAGTDTHDAQIILSVNATERQLERQKDLSLV